MWLNPWDVTDTGESVSRIMANKLGGLIGQFFHYKENIIPGGTLCLVTRRLRRWPSLGHVPVMYPTLRLSGVLAKSASLAWLGWSHHIHLSIMHAISFLTHYHLVRSTPYNPLDRSLQHASRPYSGHWWLLGPGHGFDSCPPRLLSLRHKTQVSSGADLRPPPPPVGFSVRDLARPPRCQHDEWL